MANENVGRENVKKKPRQNRTGDKEQQTDSYLYRCVGCWAAISESRTVSAMQGLHGVPYGVTFNLFIVA